MKLRLPVADEEPQTSTRDETAKAQSGYRPDIWTFLLRAYPPGSGRKRETLHDRTARDTQDARAITNATSSYATKDDTGQQTFPTQATPTRNLPQHGKGRPQGQREKTRRWSKKYDRTNIYPLPICKKNNSPNANQLKYNLYYPNSRWGNNLGTHQCAPTRATIPQSSRKIPPHMNRHRNDPSRSLGINLIMTTNNTNRYHLNLCVIPIRKRVYTEQENERHQKSPERERVPNKSKKPEKLFTPKSNPTKTRGHQRPPRCAITAATHQETDDQPSQNNAGVQFLETIGTEGEIHTASEETANKHDANRANSNHTRTNDRRRRRRGSRGVNSAVIIGTPRDLPPYE